MGARMTPAQIDEIIQLKADGVPVRAIAERVGCATGTVQTQWHSYLDATRAERRTYTARSVQGSLSSMSSGAGHLARLAGEAEAAGDIKTAVTAWKSFVDASRQVLERGAERDEDAQAAVSEAQGRQPARVVARMLEVPGVDPAVGVLMLEAAQREMAMLACPGTCDYRPGWVGSRRVGATSAGGCLLARALPDNLSSKACSVWGAQRWNESAMTVATM
jgi:hypothetical protein